MSSDDDEDQHIGTGWGSRIGTNLVFHFDYNRLDLRQDAFMITMSLAIPFGFAVIFFSQWLFRDYEVKSLPIQFMFALTFTMSVNMQLLIIFEIVDWMNAETRWLMWKLDLYCLIMLLTTLMPISFFWTLVRQRRFVPLRAQFFIVGSCYVGFLYLYSLLGSHIPTSGGGDHDVGNSNDPTSGSTPNHHELTNWQQFEGLMLQFWSIEYSVGRIGVLGVAAMATLSGFGAIENPYKHLTIFLHPYSDKEIENLEQRALQTLNQIASKKKRLVLIRQNLRYFGSDMDKSKKKSRELHHTGEGKKSPLWLIIDGTKWTISMFLRVVCGLRFGYGEDLEAQAAQLETEIRSLEDFHRELFLDINEMHNNRERLLFSKTIRGYFYFMLGYVFSIYCVYRCFMAIFNIVLNRNPENDPITRGFEIFFMFFNVQLDVQFWSQLISLALVGVLVFASVRGFLITIAKIFHQISTSISSNSVVLLLGQMMGMYFISFTLLMRMNLPIEYRQVVTNVLGGDIQFSFYHRFFDRIFLSSAICTTCVMYILHRQKEARTRTHSFEDKLA